MLKQGYRKPPKKAPQPNFVLPESFSVQLRTITPMFGGSATTDEVDPLWPVRAASVRGHLRFWWRATAGAKYASAKELFAAESEIWGNTEKAGQVRVEVDVTDAGKESEPVRHERNRNGRLNPAFTPRGAAYALFPFQGTIKHGQTEEHPAKARENVAFTLNAYCPEPLRAQVEAAIHAWVMFGGIGSRTRRGCGSLELVGEALKPPRDVNKGENPLSVLPQRYFVGPPQRDAVAAWAEAVALYRDFRQGEGIGRNEGQQPNRPGRSRYPEPDTLRDITGKYGHQTIHPVRGFPRANLGLPIIFHFQKQRGQPDEPHDQTMQGKGMGKQRFASPVITKAIQQGGKWLPLIALLDSPNVWEGEGVELKGGREIKPSEINLSTDKLQKIKPLAGKPIRQAFIAFAKEQGFKEVKL